MQLPELASLRRELHRAGAFEHRECRSWLKLGVLLAGLAGCFVTIAVVGWWIAFAVVPLAAVLATAISMVGHEGSHRSFSASPFRNAVVNYFAFPLFSGL